MNKGKQVVAPKIATRKRLHSAYNKGYNAARKRFQQVIKGKNSFIAPETKDAVEVEAKSKKTEVVLNIGSVRIQINTED